MASDRGDQGEPRDSLNPVALAVLEDPDGFEEQTSQAIRKVWHDGRWFFSLIDVIGPLTGNLNPRRY